MGIVVVTEKPAVARLIGSALGLRKSYDGFIAGNGYAITWAVGHLVRIVEPAEMNPRWRRWRFEDLPMIPAPWRLAPLADTQRQLEIVNKLINHEQTDSLICATDPGREGELIFRAIYEFCNCRKPVQRLWVSALTEEGIRQGFSELKGAAEFDQLGASALARSHADWLVGMNLSRAYTLSSNKKIAVGRVQTPTLALIVARDLEIARFKPRDEFQVRGRFGTGEDTIEAWLVVKNSDDAPDKKKKEPSYTRKKFATDKDVPKISMPLDATVQALTTKKTELPPPLLFDLTSLQTDCYRLFKFTADSTLKLAQSLYEKKVITYPRTDSRHLPSKLVERLPQVVSAIVSPYADKVVPETGQRTPGKRFVNDSKVTDHHAIIPTGETRPLAGDEASVYDVICRRFLKMWQPAHVYEQVSLILTTEGGDMMLWRSSGTKLLELGWQRLSLKRGFTKDQILPPTLARGERLPMTSAETVKTTTSPPKPLNDGTLLKAMEQAGSHKPAEDSFGRRGIGTPATRAGIIETLLRRKLVVRNKAALVSTPAGRDLIDATDKMIQSPEMTAEWEKKLDLIVGGELSYDQFIADISNELRTQIADIRAAGLE